MGGYLIKDEFLKKFLKEIKRNISSGNFTFPKRNKNIKFLRDHGLDIDNDVKDAIMQLSPKDKAQGPEEDRAGYPGYIFKFKSKYLTEEVIYIKIRYNPPDEVVCISFHDDEN